MHHLPRFALVSALGALLAACAPSAPPIAAGAMHDEILASMNRSGVDSLAPGVANVIAFYVLSRGDSVIVHDHSS